MKPIINTKLSICIHRFENNWCIFGTCVTTCDWVWEILKAITPENPRFREFCKQKISLWLKGYKYSSELLGYALGIFMLITYNQRFYDCDFYNLRV